MHHIVHILRTQWLGAIGILVGVTGVAFGATGQPALLGKLNQADKPTIIQNTANGPAATFKTKATKPPFTVTSGKQVPKLNASKLGGKPASAFAAAGFAYTKAESDAKYAPAGSSYTKADSDAKYPLAADTYTKGEIDLGFAPKGALADYYTKTAADAAFAPASGSPNYAPTGSRTLATFGTGNPENVSNSSSQLLPPREFTAPADGTILIALTGICFGSAANTTGTVSVTADGSGPDVDNILGTAHILCDVTDSVAVAAGDVVEVRADMTASNGTVQLEDFSGSVYFVPN